MKKQGVAFSDHVFLDKRLRKRSDFPLFTNPFSGLFPLLFLVVLFLLLFLRVFYLQVVRGGYYKDISNGNRIKKVVLPAPRGIIFDRNNKPLVRNVAAYKKIQDKNVELLEKDEALQLIATKKDQSIQIDTIREYLYDDLFAHVLGYIGQVNQEELTDPKRSDYLPYDFIGKMGLESSYEDTLHGIHGEEMYEVNAIGEQIRRLGSRDSISGKDLKTTLDIDIQKAVYEALASVNHGAVVVSDVKTGGILALYSKPAFDPNLFTHPKSYKGKGSYSTLSSLLTSTSGNPFMNRIISGVYPPGSTFKLVSGVAALEEGRITESTKIEDTGVLKIGEFSFGNWYFSQYGGKEGELNIVGALRRSNDIFFYKIAESTGVDSISEWGKKFGLGKVLGIDLPAEAKGLLPTKQWKKENLQEDWYLGDTYHYGIGQGFLLTTPLQVNTWASVFAADGVLYQPHVVAGKEKILAKDFLKKDNINLIREGMKQACETGGTAWPLFDFRVKNDALKVDNLDITEVASSGAKLKKITLACKTGTAETTPNEKPHAWISVYAPYHNPEVLVTVLVERSGEGSSVAGPIAKKILEVYFSKKNN